MTENSHNQECIAIDNNFIVIVQRVIEAALEYEKLTNGKRNLGITGQVGEVFACYELGLRLILDSRSMGYDAFDAKDKRVQIKTRRSESEGLAKDVGRLSTFSRHKFDYALLVLLDHEYQIQEIWQADYGDLLPIIEREKRRNPSLSAFKAVMDPYIISSDSLESGIIRHR